MNNAQIIKFNPKSCHDVDREFSEIMAVLVANNTTINLKMVQLKRTQITYLKPNIRKKTPLLTTILNVVKQK